MENVLEVAPTGRAKCRGCRESIAKGEVRFGEVFDSAFAGGEALRYWHVLCAAKNRGVAGKLRELLAATELVIANRAEVDEALAGGGKRAGKGGEKAFPYAELAPTGRARCMECDEGLPKGELRVAVERETETPMGMTVRGAGYLHPACALDWADEQGQERDVFAAAVVANSTLEEAQSAALAAVGYAR